MYPLPPPYDPYPTIPPPPPPPRRRHFWRWLLLAFALLFTSVICALGTPAFVQGWHNGEATQTAIHTTPSSQARMGGTLDDFVAQYGLPTRTAPDFETFTSGNMQITAYVNKNQTVNKIFISGPASWTWVDTQSACEQFLPDGASKISSAVGDRLWVNYHTSLGEITMQLQAPTCLLFIAPS